MPGIVGLITRMPRERAEAQLSKMVEAIRHESFYETGTWIDEAAGIYLGWAFRKNSFAALNSRFVIMIEQSCRNAAA